MKSKLVSLLAQFKNAVAICLFACFGSAETLAADKEGVPAGGVVVESLPVQGNIHMLVSKGGNMAVQVGPDGKLAVDSSHADIAKDLFSEIQKLGKGDFRFMINTSASPDHSGGNYELSIKGGSQVDRPYNAFGSTIAGTIIYAHENVLTSMSSSDKIPANGWPTDTFFTNEMDLYFNGEAVSIYHIPGAHSNGDSIVHFRRSDVVVTGEIMRSTTYPVINVDEGGSINGILNGLNFVLKLTVPENLQEDGTLVIPGKGRICDEADVTDYRDMLTVIRDRVKDMKSKGMSLKEVLKAKPSYDYDGRYAAKRGPTSAKGFITNVYNTL